MILHNGWASLALFVIAGLILAALAVWWSAVVRRRRALRSTWPAPQHTTLLGRTGQGRASVRASLPPGTTLLDDDDPLVGSFRRLAATSYVRGVAEVYPNIVGGESAPPAPPARTGPRHRSVGRAGERRPIGYGDRD